MNILKDKYQKWVGKVKSGDSKYFMITRTKDNNWYFVNGNHAEPVISLRIATDEGNGLCSEYEYLSNHTESVTTNFTIIVKDDDKMIIQIGDEEKGFGFKDVPYPVKAITIHCKMAYLHAFLFGSQSSCTINTVLASVRGSEDAIEDCMSKFYNALNSAKPTTYESEMILDA